MSLISRDAAIAAIQKCIDEVDVPEYSGEDWENLLQVQVACGVKVGAENALLAVNDIPSPWVSVKDRLPEVNSENGNVMYKDGLPGYFCSVLACYVDGSGTKIVQPLSFYVDSNNNPHWTVYNNVSHDWFFHVDRWMPLPEPPED